MAQKNAQRRPTKQAFVTEADLVERFIGKLQRGRTCYGRVEVATEWDHRSGVVDILARDSDGALIAFEAKLDNWRRAYLQAYRNTAYANKAYVLLPPAAAERALQDRSEFELRGIGLCSFDGRTVRVHVEAADQRDALLAWVRARAHEHLDAIADEHRTRSQPASDRRRSVQAARV